MEGDEDGSRRSIATGAARTTRRSTWAATDVFSDDDAADDADGGDARTRGGRTGRATTAAPSQRGAGKGRKGSQREDAGAGARLPGGRGGSDPLDLLDAGTSRQLARSAAGVGADNGAADDFGRADDGKMIIEV
jgi:hypothetical protein